jgi:MFS family permease
MTYWFTADERARWVGVFVTGAPLSLVIGAPISGLILDTFDGFMGLGGWQWLFIIKGVPSVLVGLWVLRHFTDKPRDTAWLEPEERIALQARIDHERKSREAIRHYKLWEGASSKDTFTILLRASASNEDAAAKMRGIFATQVMRMLTQVTDRAEIGIRAGFVEPAARTCAGERPLGAAKKVHFK